MFKKMKQKVADETRKSILKEYATSLNVIPVDPEQTCYVNPETRKKEKLFPDHLEIGCVCDRLIGDDVAIYVMREYPYLDILLFLDGNVIQCFVNKCRCDEGEEFEIWKRWLYIGEVGSHQWKRWLYIGEVGSHQSKIKNNCECFSATISAADKDWFDRARLNAYVRAAGNFDYEIKE